MPRYLSITGVTADKKLAKYMPFDSEADADAHAAEYSGFVVEDPGGNKELWTVDASAKTVTRDTDVETATTLSINWKNMRRKRDGLLHETDWVITMHKELGTNIPSAWKDYRKALRDLPANTADPTDITWPTKPS